MSDDNLKKIISSCLNKLSNNSDEINNIYNFSSMEIEKVYQNTIYFNKVNKNSKLVKKIPILISQVIIQMNHIEKILDSYFENKINLTDNMYNQLDKQSNILYSISNTLSKKYNIDLNKYEF